MKDYPFIFLSFVLLICPVSYGQDTGHNRDDFEDEKSKLLNKIKQNWADQIQHAHELHDTTEPSLKGSDDEIVVHGGYIVTSPDNPLVSENCRMESLVDAVLHLQEAEHMDQDQAFKTADDHIRKQKQAYQDGITFSDWLHHVAECKNFCNIAVLKLLKCHVEAVARHDHSLVLFDFNSDRINPEYDQDEIKLFAEKLQHKSDKEVLLIGRSSRIGNVEYNRKLSRSRAEAIRQILQSYNISDEKITLQALGYEEPQLNAWMARVYDLEETYDKIGELGINQSVLMVLY